MISNLKICFMGGNQAGAIGLLTILSKGIDLLSVVSYSAGLNNLLENFYVPVYPSIHEENFIHTLSKADVLLSVHGREIVPPELLKLPKFGGVNIHPYLYKYKGPDPVRRALKENNYKGSVGAHIMGEQLDKGKTVVEEFADVSGSNSVEEIYNKLYPYYSIVILKALEIIGA